MTRFFLSVFGFIALCVAPSLVSADDSATARTNDYDWADFRLSDQPSTSAGVSPTTPMISDVNRLRQARAAYRYNQRVARMETNAWFGYEPLRPDWNSVPMMSSRYPVRRTVVVPVFVD